MDDIELPEWLTTKFLENLLENNKTKDVCKIEITNHDITRCVPKGSNYLSNILRIQIEFKKVYEDRTVMDSTSLVAKVPLTNDVLAALNDSGVIEREIEAYYDLIPKINSILSKAGCTTIAPKCYKCDIDNVLILEDLTATGYTMADRKEQMDYEHAALVMKHLAKLHASSVKLHETDPKLVERVGRHLIFQDEMDPDVLALLDPIMGVSHFEILKNEVGKYPDTGKFVDFLSKLQPKIWDCFLKAITWCDDELMVLNHGDSWTNNMLFRYKDDGTPHSLIFVDWQLLRFTSQALDLYYYMYTSIKLDVLQTRYFDLLDVYLDHFNAYLEKYGSSKRLDKATFRKTMEKRELYGLIQAANILPFMMADRDKISDDESDEYNGNIYAAYTKNPKFLKLFIKHLQDFSSRDWFESFK